MASENKGCLRTRYQWQEKDSQTGNPTRNTFTWAADWSASETCKSEIFIPFDVPIKHFLAALHSCTSLPSCFLRKFWTVYSVCVCSCFPVCVWMSHPGVTPPYVGGWFGGPGVFGLCQSAGPRQNCSHNWPLCSKCHSSQRKRRDPIAASLALLPRVFLRVRHDRVTEYYRRLPTHFLFLFHFK